MARTKNAAVPEVGSEVPEFNLPSAQGGNLRLGMRTATGRPVIVAFYRADSDEDVAYFKELAAREDEINLALGSIVGIGVCEPDAAREFLKATGLKSYILYDYSKVATPVWGLLEPDGEARPVTFLIGEDNKVVELWTAERPSPGDLLAKVSEITGLPKEPEEDGEEKPKKPAKGKASKTSDEGSEPEESKSGGSAPGDAKEKPSPEEREKRRAERKAAKKSEEEAQGEKTAEVGAEAKESKEKDSAQGGAKSEGTEAESAKGDASNSEESLPEEVNSEGSEAEERSSEEKRKPEEKGS